MLTFRPHSIYHRLKLYVHIVFYSLFVFLTSNKFSTEMAMLSLHSDLNASTRTWHRLGQALTNASSEIPDMICN